MYQNDGTDAKIVSNAVRIRLSDDPDPAKQTLLKPDSPITLPQPGDVDKIIWNNQISEAHPLTMVFFEKDCDFDLACSRLGAWAARLRWYALLSFHGAAGPNSRFFTGGTCRGLGKRCASPVLARLTAQGLSSALRRSRLRLPALVRPARRSALRARHAERHPGPLAHARRDQGVLVVRVRRMRFVSDSHFSADQWDLDERQLNLITSVRNKTRHQGVK